MLPLKLLSAADAVRVEAFADAVATAGSWAAAIVVVAVDWIAVVLLAGYVVVDAYFAVAVAVAIAAALLPL